MATAIAAIHLAQHWCRVLDCCGTEHTSIPYVEFFFSVSATLFGAFNYKTSVVSDLVCLLVFSVF